MVAGLDLGHDPAEDSISLFKKKEDNYGSVKIEKKPRNDSALDFSRFGQWWKKLSDTFGLRYLSFLFATQHVGMGLVRTLIHQVQKLAFVQFHVPAPHMQIFLGLVMLPWAIKPVFAILSESKPLFGYSKLPYLGIGAIGTAIALAILGSFRTELSLYSLATMFFLCNAGLCMLDLMAETSYSMQIRDHPTSAPDLMAYIFGGTHIAQICGLMFGGYVIAASSHWAVLGLLAIPMGLVLLPIAKNYMGEVPLNTEERTAAQARLWEHGEVCGVGLTVSALALGLVGFAMHSSPTTMLMVSAAVMVIACVVFGIFLHPMVAKLNCFLMLERSMMINVSGAIFYFAIDNDEQFPTGPHFSKMFATSVLP